MFLSENSILFLVLILLVITLATRPELLLVRARDVVAGGGSEVPPWTALWRKLSTAPDLGATFWWARQDWYALDQGSWHLVDLAPLAGPVLPLLAGMWVCSWIAAPKRAVTATAYMVGFILLLGSLSVLQHVVADTSSYRDIPFVMAVSVAGLLFILRAPELWPARRRARRPRRPGRRRGARAAIMWAMAVLVAAVNFRDVEQLAGRRHMATDYGPQEVALLETLRNLTAHRTQLELGASRLVVAIADGLVPIRGLYLDLLKARGFVVTTAPMSDFCRDRDGVVRSAGAAACDAFLLAQPLAACSSDQVLGARERVVLFRYEPTCPANWDEAARRSRAVILLAGASLDR